jgi:hypothetical protein
MFYDSMKEKIKYFTPAFHSITPEGLNSRLTFLQQCTRPGDTIPVIGTDGKPRYDNAVNTAFGAPPVLILRVGDFYHTKIIPTSLQIAYEPLLLDINPEGIGVQPMLAKITLSFNFIGGEGLKEPIDKLQNALSFNYYANTEMYDERADFTDESFRKIDEELIKSIADEPPTNKPTSKIENDGGSPIGEVQQASGITYQKIMNSFYDSGQAYINTVYNKFEQINNDYKLSTLQISTSSSPLFNSGKGLEFSTSATELGIVGKGISYQLTSDKLFKQIEDDINSVNGKNDSGDEFIKLLYINSIKKTTIKQIKNNLINQVRLSNLSYNTNLTQVINELVNSQLNLINVMSKIDYVATNSDGYIKPDQSLEIYSLSSTTEVQVGGAYSNTYDELVGDYNSGLNKLKKYYDFLKTKKYVENPYNLNSNENPAGNNSLNNVYIFRFYVGMSKIILTEDLFQQFKNNIMTQEVLKLEDGEKALKVFDKYFNGFKEVSKKQKETEKNYFDTTIRYEYDRDYKEWNPFVKDKVRNFNFSINAAPTDEQKTRLQNIYKNGNSNTNTRVFNGKKKFN